MCYIFCSSATLVKLKKENLKIFNQKTVHFKIKYKIQKHILYNIDSPFLMFHVNMQTWLYTKIDT